MALSAVEIDSIREAFEDETLQDTAVISRPTKTPDGQGGKTSTWSVVATVPARIAPAIEGGGQAEGSMAGRAGASSSVFVNVPALTDVRLTDRVAILGRALEVVELDAPRSWEFTRKVTCREIT